MAEKLSRNCRRTIKRQAHPYSTVSAQPLDISVTDDSLAHVQSCVYSSVDNQLHRTQLTTHVAANF